MPGLTLDEAEIRELAGGYKRADKQLAELHRQGFVRARRSPMSGRVVLERSHVLAVTEGRAAAAPAQNDEPELHWNKAA